jgi:GNAT superfamily N-acetyltransferase
VTEVADVAGVPDVPRPAIRAATGDADHALLTAIVNATSPDDPTSIEEIRWSDATYPGGIRYLAEVDGAAVGAATVGRIYRYPPEHPGFWGAIAVLPEARHQGIGERLLRAISDTARSAGKTELHIGCAEHRPEGIEFLAHRGFAELERSKTVRLELAGLAAPTVVAPPGIEIVTLAARPDLVQGVHAVALETFDDIPGGEDRMAAGDLAEFRARDVDRPSIPHDAFFVAVDTASGRAVGYASLLMVPGSTTTAWHDMTAVLRAYRGRGIARVVKEATIGWALDHGLTALETGNDVANAPMRAVNARLGYRPLPDEITMRGPLFGGMMAR